MTTARRRLIATVTAALVVLVAAPWFVFTQYLPRFVTHATSLAGAPIRRSKLAVPVAAREVRVLIIDGLGYPFARTVDQLDTLSARGCVRPLWAAFPTYTSPQLISMVTGAGPQDSGVRLNAAPEEATRDMDHLLAVARDTDRNIAVFDNGWPPLQALMFAREDELTRGELATWWAPYVRLPSRAGSITISYYLNVDTQGHEHGAASPQYAEAAHGAGQLIQRHADTLDFEQDVLVVVSDHGHLARGGHGGIEPEMREAFFLAIGRGIQRGLVLERRPIRDVASTISMLAGLPTPAHNLGRPMLDVTTWTPSAKAEALASTFDQAAGLQCVLHPDPGCERIAALSEQLSRGDRAALAPAESLLDTLDQRRRAALETDEASSRGWRLVGAFGFVFAVVLAIATTRRRGWFGDSRMHLVEWCAPLVLVGVHAAFLLASGYRLTFSMMPPQESFLRDAAIGTTIGLVAALLMCTRLRATRHAAPIALSSIVLPFVMLCAYVGTSHRVVVPPHAGLLVLLASPTLIGASLFAILIAVIDYRRVSASQSS